MHEEGDFDVVADRVPLVPCLIFVVAEAQNCILGLMDQGYKVGFARVSSQDLHRRERRVEFAELTRLFSFSIRKRSRRNSRGFVGSSALLLDNF